MNNNGNLFWQNVAQGTIPAVNCPAPTPMVLPSGNSCQQPATMGPTGPSTLIDPLAIDLGGCGMTSFRFTNANTDSVLTKVIFAGNADCLEHILCPPAAAGAPVPLPDSDGFDSLFNGQVFPNGEMIQCFGDISVGSPFFVTTLTFKPANQASADLMANAEVQTFSVDAAANFKLCDKFTEVNACSQCFTSSSGFEPLTWNLGVVPVGTSSGFAIEVPAGVSGRFDLCIAGVGRNVNVVPCAVPASTCSY